MSRLALLSAEERAGLGKRARQRLPRERVGDWDPKTMRREDPVAILRRVGESRLPELLPVKYGRMAASPFGFFRGAVPVLAADIGPRPWSGLPVQICGDAHVRNLGAFAAPDGHLVFDLNDFDETLPGAPWEWDILRFAASLVLAGREAGGSEARCREAALTFARTWREALGEFSRMRALDLRRFEVRRRTGDVTVRDILAQAERATPDRLLRKMCVTAPDGRPHFRAAPPMLHPVSDEEEQSLCQALEPYRLTLQADRRLTLDSYHPVDAAFRAGGTGSIGTRVYVVLLLGRAPDDALILQLKEQPAAGWCAHAPACEEPHQGKRVAEGQLRMQTATDPFLGWTTFGGRDYLVRQLADHKASIDPTLLRGHALLEYAFVSGQILAKAHARTGDALALAAYAGAADKLDVSVAGFATAYADQSAQDHALLLAAIKRGDLPAELSV